MLAEVTVGSMFFVAEFDDLRFGESLRDLSRQRATHRDEMRRHCTSSEAEEVKPAAEHAELAINYVWFRGDCIVPTSLIAHRCHDEPESSSIMRPSVMVISEMVSSGPVRRACSRTS